MNRIAILLLVLLVGGCRTLHADREDFTKASALEALHGYYPLITKVHDDGIELLSLSGDSIKYADIAEVRLVPKTFFIVFSPFCGFIYGPFHYRLIVTMKTGEDVVVISSCRFALNLLPLWLYPNMLIHGYEPGFALDWLRQYGTLPEADLQGKR